MVGGLACYDMWDAMRRLLILLALSIGLVTLVACTIYFERIDRFWGITQTDFSVFYDAGYRMTRHESLYEYRPTHFTTDREYLFKYAPPFALAMMPLAGLAVNVAIRWWYALTALALLGAVGGVCVLVRRATPRLPWEGILLACVMILRPYLANLRLGQVDVILAGLLIAFLVALQRRREVLAGWCLGATIVCKLIPAVWLIYLAMTRRWRALAWTLVAGAVYLASPVAHLGLEGTRQTLVEWWGVLGTAGGNWEWLVRPKNQSVLSLVLRGMTGSATAAVTPMTLRIAMGITTVAGLLYGWGVWRTIRRARADDRSLAALVPPALVMIAMVIFSPHAWKATFIHLLLPYTLVATHLIVRAPRDAVGWGLLAGSFLLVSATASDAGLGPTLADALAVLSPMTWGAGLLAAGVWRVGQDERAGR